MLEQENNLGLSTSTHDAVISTAHVDCDSFDEFAEATSRWALDWRQLDRGPLKAKLMQVATPSLFLSQFWLSRKFHQRGASPPGVRTFGITNAHSSPVEWNGREGPSNQIVVFPNADEYECVSNPGFLADGVSAPEDLIRATAQILGLPDALEKLSNGPCYIEADPHHMDALRRSLGRFHTAVRTQSDTPLSPTACADLEFEIHSALVTALAMGWVTDSRTPDATLRSRALRRATNFIEEHADDAPTVTDICRASGASYRTLNYAFHERFGVSPKQYLQAVRLEGVRKGLRRMGSKGNIADIANRWGFWHMGQFAADYRKMFGKLPSQSLPLQGNKSSQ